MHTKIILPIFILLTIQLCGQPFMQDKQSRKSQLNFALLLKHKGNKSIKEEVQLAKLYHQLGYQQLAAERYRYIAKNERNEKVQRAFLKRADSLENLPYKRLYARSFLYKKAPELVVEQWLTEKPEMQGKFILVDFWATWCAPCKKGIPELNAIHATFDDQLVVVGLSDEKAEKVERMTFPVIEYYKAIDTQKSMYSMLQIRGIPHAILIHPNGKVIWEGFPFDHTDPLTKDKVGELLKIFE